jgi:NAD(P)-dependent dehydrogenase (short-subunit alcohol dehydrogenase family)
MDRLKDKTALIFGADEITSGIATRYLQEGASVRVVDTDAALAGFAAGAGQFPVASRKPALIAAAVRQALGDANLDILVIGGGDLPTEAQWQAIDAVDPATIAAGTDRETAAALAAVQAAGPALKENGGAIVFLFNPASLYSEGGWGDAAMLHHAKRGLARTLASEWGQYQIRVNTLAPLARTSAFEAYRARNSQEVDWRISKVAMQRVGDPVKDIGGAAVFLASDDTRYLTGSIIFADGGNFLTTPVIETTVETVA